MVAHYYNSPTLPWTVSEEDEQRFRRILKRILLACLLISLVMPWLPLPKVDRTQVEELPPKKVEADKPVGKKDIESARKKASGVGLLALKDDLADLRSAPAAVQLNKDIKPGPGVGAGSGPGVGAGKSAGVPSRALITSNAAGGSGGINTAKLSRDTGGGGLAGRATTLVEGTVGGGGGGGTGGSLQRGGSGKAGRSLEEIKLVFDRNKGAIYSIYNRALREDPSLQGKVVLKLSIAATGQVLDCKIVSSELRSPELERKLVARIRQFDFGARNVDTMVVTYPIDFLPS
ncbi:MAG: energy transducer TonB [Proteobacteria bacterium]|nr:energy transducer TonB [Pseudomonadota bacterium]